MAADKTEWVIGKTLARQARERGNSIYIQYEDDAPVTYAGAHRAANAMGNAFAGIGVGRGEQVILMLHNRLEYLWCWFGLARLGAAAVAG